MNDIVRFESLNPIDMASIQASSISVSSGEDNAGQCIIISLKVPTWKHDVAMFFHDPEDIEQLILSLQDMKSATW